MVDVSLLELLNKYSEKYCGKLCVMQSNYRNLNEFTVEFDEYDFHHLIGINKVTGYHANESIKLIKNEQLLFSDIIKHQNFSEIKPRILNFNFIYQIFDSSNEIKCCVLGKDLTKNNMNLSVVFYKEKSNRYIVLGLREIKSKIYKPITLHEGKGNYKQMRQTKCEIIKWIDKAQSSD